MTLGDRELRFEATEDGTAKRIVIDGLATGHRGLPVEITVAGEAHSNHAPGVFEAAIFLQFTPDARPPTCTIEPDQRGCPRGGELTGAVLNGSTVLDPRRPHFVLRVACCLATEWGVRVCATAHDAILIEAPLEKLNEHVETARSAMAEASKFVLDGFELRTDVKVFPYPERYRDDRGTKTWERIWRIVERLDGGS